MISRKITAVLSVLFLFSLICGVYLILQGEVSKCSQPQLSSLISKQVLKKENIMVIKASGVLQESPESRSFGFSGTEAINEKLIEAGRMEHIKAVVLRINSPGGSVATVQEIYNEILRLKKKGKIIVASFGDISASGGYYIAAACDKIVANPGTITGSIGVIMEVGNVEELFKKIGVKLISIKSGKYKDIGSPSRALTDEERQIFQSLINDAYEQFVDSVVKGRGMDKKVVLTLADGRVFTGRQALEAGLVDALGGEYEAVRLAAKLADIPENDIRIYEPRYNLKHFISLIESRILDFPLLARFGLENKPKFRMQYVLE